MSCLETQPAGVSFAALNLPEPLQRALREKGYQTPSPIQALAIPPALAGHDVLGCAQTGTGKTAAFALPLLTHLAAHRKAPGRGRARILVLAPTRELAVQIHDGFRAYGRHMNLSHAAIFGGVNQFHQVRALDRGLDVLVATPGRLLDLMNQGRCNLSSVEALVLDEADRMLDMGFLPDVRRVVAAIPTKRQTLFFSATMPPAIEALARSILRNPERIEVAPAGTTADRVEQRVLWVPRQDKTAALQRTLESNPGRALVFCRTKHGADRVERQLVRAGIRAEAIHGNKSQNARQRALEAFRSGSVSALVATDIAARGIDVRGVELVVNYDLPQEPESYVHRIGRTARAGASGLAISLCDPSERGLLRSIERLIKQSIPTATDASAPASAAPAAATSVPAARPQNNAGARAHRGPRHDRKPAPARSAQGRTRSRTRRDEDPTTKRRRWLDWLRGNGAAAPVSA